MGYKQKQLGKIFGKESSLRERDSWHQACLLSSPPSSFLPAFLLDDKVTLRMADRRILGQTRSWSHHTFPGCSTSELLYVKKKKKTPLCTCPALIFLSNWAEVSAGLLDWRRKGKSGGESEGTRFRFANTQVKTGATSLNEMTEEDYTEEEKGADGTQI